MAGFTWTQRPLKEFLKTMIIGGISFLLPIALAAFILSYAFRLVKHIATPISHGLHLDQWGDVAGVSAATFLSVLALVFLPSPPALSLAPRSAGASPAGLRTRCLVACRITS
jgi:hypothetical protein